MMKDYYTEDNRMNDVKKYDVIVKRLEERGVI